VGKEKYRLLLIFLHDAKNSVGNYPISINGMNDHQKNLTGRTAGENLQFPTFKMRGQTCGKV